MLRGKYIVSGQKEMEPRTPRTALKKGNIIAIVVVKTTKTVCSRSLLSVKSMVIKLHGSFMVWILLKSDVGHLKKGSSSISEFILKVKIYGNGLRSAGQTVTDPDLLLSVLNGLVHGYNKLVLSSPSWV
ncbi:hypothetical protein ACOSP7_009102 [Xanthoceras sorbifolium]